ncbi:hypothetical protein JVT61DRAFT_7361 [Boletus reticuloceps]|uniref:Uncharacterized protein n=1 Tax=Boletus reticuloceps TaxID=495285 RepID=A0A8I2YIQ5_9AGAM|nr:hypothetical protein JVT61DRAFT_7361 [Boletus reticuloceps]
MDKELIAAMPHDVHEEPFSRLRTELDGAINLIPLDFDNGNNEVVVQVHTDSRVKGCTILGYPDTQIRIFFLTDDLRLARPLPYFFLECAYSQGDGDVTRKLKAYMESFPKAIGVMKIGIRESRPFQSPDTNTDLARSLAGRKVSRWQEWKPSRGSPTVLGPIIAHSITWIDISMIEVHIWVRTGRRPIDITSDIATDTQDYAFGTLYPAVDMADVNEMLDIVLRRIRDTAVCYAVKNHIYQLKESNDGSDSDGDDEMEGDDEGAGDHRPSSMDVGLDWSSDSESDSEESNPELQGLAEAQAWSPPKPLVNWGGGSCVAT